MVKSLVLSVKYIQLYKKNYDVKETYVFELSFKALAETEVAPIAYEMIPRFPSITRDIALVVDQDKTAG